MPREGPDSIVQMIENNIDKEQADLLNLHENMDVLESYFEQIELKEGNALFVKGDTATNLYFLLKGQYSQPASPLPSFAKKNVA